MPIAIHSLHNEVGHKRIIFPGGEVHVTVDNITIGTERIQIHADLFSSDDIMELMMVTNAIKVQWPGYQIELVMPYIPYARQDRVGLQGEALSIKVFADFINSQNYVSVEVWDAHSDVALALIDRVTNVGQYELLRDFIPHIPNPDNTILVSPDAGANKKIFQVARELGFKEVVRADKKRDMATGKITGTVVYSEHVSDKDFLIVDDLADGAYTFIALAEKLRILTTGRVMLYVTHAIFSKGLDILYPLFDKVFTPNMILKNWKEMDTHGIVVTL